MFKKHIFNLHQMDWVDVVAFRNKLSLSYMEQCLSLKHIGVCM